MGRRPKITEREKRFIRRAARIAKHTTGSAIAGRMERSVPTVTGLIKKEGLRTPEETKRIWKEIRSRSYLKHPKFEEVASLLRETKAKRNMSIRAIAHKCSVPISYVQTVASREKILSKEERRGLGKKFVGRKPRAKPIKFKSNAERAAVFRHAGLSQVEKDVLRRRATVPPESFESIGKSWDITREMARQHEESAREKTKRYLRRQARKKQAKE